LKENGYCGFPRGFHSSHEPVATIQGPDRFERSATPVAGQKIKPSSKTPGLTLYSTPAGMANQPLRDLRLSHGCIAAKFNRANPGGLFQTPSGRISMIKMEDVAAA
jgi:hypothetical protein